MLTILPLSEENRTSFNRVDSRFLAGDRVQLHVTHKGFTLEYAPLPMAGWRDLKPFPADVQCLMADIRVACYLAFTDGQCTGQAIVRHGSHRMCELLDIRTDSRYRRQGIGAALLGACMDWAKKAGFAGLRAETCDTQPVACQFFEHCGFVLGGVDRLRHTADPEQARLMPAMRESVLTFYKLF